jgi:adenylosuccinate synthase
MGRNPHFDEKHLPIEERMLARGWMDKPGAFALVDGQFGSTGKGLAEQVLALHVGYRATCVTTNAGPNSGHTIYDDQSGQKYVTKQIPSFNVALWRRPDRPNLYINGGAMLDPDILRHEANEFAISPFIHPAAAAILPEHKEINDGRILAIASTNKGTGPALAAKIMRDRFAVAENRHEFRDYAQLERVWDWTRDIVFVSTAQGYSLGLNSGFYPYTTCRECTVQQALADANIPARRLRKVLATYRTYPIRVGNTRAGFSGGHYPDQREIEWAELGVEPETTTVTRRVRRVFTWSDEQFIRSTRANEPDAVFLNFLNYFKSVLDAQTFLERVWRTYVQVMRRDPDFFMLGFGPRHTDVTVAFDLNEAMLQVAAKLN